MLIETKYFEKDNTIYYKKITFNEEFILKKELCKFNKIIKFIDITFQKGVVFDGCVFEKDLYFENCIFKENISFKNCIFYGEFIFRNVEFSCELSNKKVFMHAKLNGQKILFENIKNMPRLDGFVFSKCSKVLLNNIKYIKCDYENAKVNYRIAKNQCSITGDYDMLGHYYYMERYYGGKSIKKDDFQGYFQYINVKFLDFLSKILMGYGEKPINVFIVSFFIISIFAIFYMILGIKYNNRIIKLDNIKNEFELLSCYIDLWYFSMITFTTVGYGEMTAINIFGKILVSIEVFLGVTMGASWASVIFRKMSR